MWMKQELSDMTHWVWKLEGTPYGIVVPAYDYGATLGNAARKSMKNWNPAPVVVSEYDVPIKVRNRIAKKAMNLGHTVPI